MAGSFQLWKIHSLRDAVPLILILSAGLFVFWLIALRIKKYRTKACALERISRKLRKLSRGKGIFRIVDEAARSDEGAWDAYFVVNNVLIVIKVFWKGLFARGEASGKTWWIADNKTQETVKNPLLTLLPKCKWIEGYLKERKTEALTLPLVVFADNYGRPQLSLGADCHATITRNLKKWYQKNVIGLDKNADPVKIADLVQTILEK